MSARRLPVLRRLQMIGLALAAVFLVNACSGTPAAPARVAGVPSGNAQSGAPDPSGDQPSGSATPSPVQSPTPAAPVSPTHPPTTTAGCTSVKVVGARGTGEAPGLGYLLSQVAKQIDAAEPKPVVAVGLNYPASSDFAASSQAGVTELKRVIAAETSACLVLLGYSQGAMVVGNTLASVGASGGKRISAVVLFGDPFFNSAEPYDAGSFTKGVSSAHPRRTGQFSAFGGRIRNYCNGGDTVCQGPNASGPGNHGQYTQYAVEAGRWVAGKV